ncbi:MAG: hypothetical protein WKF73_01000 [Nocardioidaceae bacterium]
MPATAALLSRLGLPAEAVVQPNATLSDTLNEMLSARYSTAIVVDSSNCLPGHRRHRHDQRDRAQLAARGAVAAFVRRRRGRRTADVSTDHANDLRLGRVSPAARPSTLLPVDDASLGRYLFMPVLLAVVLLFTYLSVSRRDLDSTESKRLASDFIVARTVEHLELTVVSTSARAGHRHPGRDLVDPLLRPPDHTAGDRRLQHRSGSADDRSPVHIRDRLEPRIRARQSSPWPPIRRCQCCATPWSASPRSTPRSSSPPAGWA